MREPNIAAGGVGSAHAARAVSVRFVGVDVEGTGQLRALGVGTVLSGFEDPDGVLAALAAARLVALPPSR